MRLFIDLIYKSIDGLLTLLSASRQFFGGRSRLSSLPATHLAPAPRAHCTAEGTLRTTHRAHPAHAAGGASCAPRRPAKLPPVLHITNGDSVAMSLRASGLGGDVSIQADVLHEGPCPADASPTEWREVRARYLADQGYAIYDEALERLVEWDAALHAARAHDEVVLWFEHDLFDQLILVRLLAWFASSGAGAARLSLVCINSYPGIVRFSGLGQLTPSQLAGLFPGRVPLTAAHLGLGADVWRRYCAPDPGPLAALLAADTRALPFLNAAIRRALEEYPSTLNGLSRSEHQALAALAAGAPDLIAAFLSAQVMEHDIFMGDSSFFRMVRALGEAPLPLVHLDGAYQTPPVRQGASLTALGREVLAGRADHARLNGLDRWVGGVRLHGRAPAWRWDPDRALVTAQA